MSALFRTFGLLALAWLPGSAWASHASHARDIIDVFPVQSWASISQLPPALKPDPIESVDDAVATPRAIPSPESAPHPFELLGEWRDNHASVFVVGGRGSDDTFIVCGKGCKINGAIRPGQEIAGGYRVKNLSPAGVQIIAQDGVAYELPVSGLGQ